MNRLEFTEQRSVLDLSQVTITATIDPTGRLGPVEGLWQKVLAAAKEAATVGLLRVMVVAQTQTGVPPELLQPEAGPLRIIQAATLEQAVAKLYEAQGVRFVVREHERRQCANLDILGKSAPIEAHYQVLPLLREVKRERLPRDLQAPNRAEDRESQLRPVDILRWEEALRAEQVTYEPVSLTQVFENFQAVAKEARTAVSRLVVLGPPGSGKTSLVQYLAWQAAKGELHLSGRQLVPARLRLREWEAWAVKPVDPELSLPEYLAEQSKDLKPAPAAVQWRDWLQRGDVLLLLDGLDEITGLPAFHNALKIVLTTFSNCPIVLTCRTVSFEQHRALCPDFPIFTLAGLNDSQRDGYIRIFPAEHLDRFDPKALIEQLNRTPQLHSLAANPLLLSIICYVVDDPQGVRLPATRGELYDKAVEKLLMRPRRLEVVYPGGKVDLPLIRKRRILERAALSLFAGLGQQRQLTVDEGTLVDALTEAAQAEGLNSPTEVADSLLSDLAQNSGLLRGSPSQGYFFLHLTVQEFLTAAALARWVNEPNGKGWKSKLRLGRRRWTIQELVNKKAWDPHWQEVIMLLARQLKNPEPLLRLLADKQQDDYFHHRLALAALCLSEIHAPHLTPCASLVDQITTVAFSCWWEHQQADTVSVIPHLIRALPSLGRVNGRVKDTPLLALLCEQLHNPDREVRSRAAEALGQIGSTLAQQPDLLVQLGAALHDPDGDVRSKARVALRQIGLALAQQPDLLVQLGTALRDPDGDVRSSAVEILGQIGPVLAQHPELLILLGTALRDPDREVRSNAAEILGQIGSVLAQQPDLLVQLGAALRDPNQNVRFNAVEILIQTGPALAQQPDLLAQLITAALRDPDWEVRSKARVALGEIGLALAQQPDLLAQLITAALHDPDREVRSRAIEVLWRIGPALAQHPDLLAQLITAALHDPAGNVRSSAAIALGQIGPALAQQPDLLAQLITAALRDPDWEVRSKARVALGEIGLALAQQPDLLAQLITAALRDPDREVRSRAAEALGQIGPALAQQPDLLAQLGTALHDPDWHVRFRVAAALGQIGPALAQQPDLLVQLGVALRGSDQHVRSRAAAALEQIGPALVQQPDLLVQLGVALHDLDWGVRSRAIEVLGRIGPALAQQPDLLAQLGTALHDPDWHVRFRVAAALGQIGPALAQQPELLAQLITAALHDPGLFIHSMAIEVLWRIGPALAQQPDLLAQLIIAALRDPDRDVRSKARVALGQIGPALAQQPDLLAQLITAALRDPDREVHSSAAEILGRIGPALAQQPELLTQLGTALRDPSGNVRSSAAEVLGQIGPALAWQPDLLAQLVTVALRDPSGNVRSSAAVALGRIGSALAWQPELLAQLGAALRDPDQFIRSSAAVALGQIVSALARQPKLLVKLGPALAQQPELLAQLIIATFRNPDRFVRSEAAAALEQIGPALAWQPELLTQLGAALHDPDWHVRFRVAAALGKLMAQGIRIFEEQPEWWRWRSVVRLIVAHEIRFFGEQPRRWMGRSVAELSE